MAKKHATALIKVVHLLKFCTICMLDRKRNCDCASNMWDDAELRSNHTVYASPFVIPLTESTHETKKAVSKKHLAFIPFMYNIFNPNPNFFSNIRDFNHTNTMNIISLVLKKGQLT